MTFADRLKFVPGTMPTARKRKSAFNVPDVLRMISRLATTEPMIMDFFTMNTSCINTVTIM